MPTADGSEATAACRIEVKNMMPTKIPTQVSLSIPLHWMVAPGTIGTGGEEL